MGKPLPTSTQSAVGTSDYDIPPVIACARCGRVACEGCADPSDPDSEERNTPGSIAWEDSGPMWQRLLQTTSQTGTQPEIFFGQMRPGPLLPAVTFAVICETVAIFGFSLVWASLFAVFFPQWALHAARSPTFLGLGVAIFLSLLTLVVFVHVLWGLTLEWGVSRTKNAPDYRQGFRFGLYACGWDLLTSPLGLLWGILRGSNRGPFGLLVAGARAPRRAFVSYLRDHRGLDETQRKRASWISIWTTTTVMAGVFLLLFCALLVALISG